MVKMTSNKTNQNNSKNKNYTYNEKEIAFNSNFYKKTLIKKAIKDFKEITDIKIIKTQEISNKKYFILNFKLKENQKKENNQPEIINKITKEFSNYVLGLSQ